MLSHASRLAAPGVGALVAAAIVTVVRPSGAAPDVVLVAVAIVAVSAGLGWGIASLVRAFQHPESTAGQAPVAVAAVIAAAIATVLAVAAMLASFLSASAPAAEDAGPPPLNSAIGIGWAVVAVTCGSATLLLAAWSSRWSLAISCSLFAAALVALAGIAVPGGSAMPARLDILLPLLAALVAAASSADHRSDGAPDRESSIGVFAPAAASALVLAVSVWEYEPVAALVALLALPLVWFLCSAWRTRAARMGRYLLFAALGTLMGVVLVALPAMPDPGATAAETLTGAALPPEPAGVALLTGRISAIWVSVVTVLVWQGVRALMTRRDELAAWSRASRGAVGIAVLLLAVTTLGPLAVYAPVLLSAHLVTLALLGALIPALLVLGMPRKRADDEPDTVGLGAQLGRTGWFPALVLAALPWVVLLSPASRWLTVQPLGRVLLAPLVFAAGLWLAWAVLRGTRRTASHRPVVPAVVLCSQLAASLVLALWPGLVLAEWYGGMGRPWEPSARSDQLVAAIAAGVVASAGLLLLLIPAWRAGRGSERLVPPDARGADPLALERQIIAEYTELLRRRAATGPAVESGAAAGRSGPGSLLGGLAEDDGDVPVGQNRERDRELERD